MAHIWQRTVSTQIPRTYGHILIRQAHGAASCQSSAEEGPEQDRTPTCFSMEVLRMQSTWAWVYSRMLSMVTATSSPFSMSSMDMGCPMPGRSTTKVRPRDSISSGSAQRRSLSETGRSAAHGSPLRAAHSHAGCSPAHIPSMA